MLTRNLIRAARALLGWEQRDLSHAAGLAEGTIQRMERVGPERSRAENVNKVQKALENGGIVFIRENGGGPGVRLREAPPENET